jgi:DNA-binding response OmpR family regulator
MAEESAVRPGRPRVLVVEDEVAIAVLIDEELREAGFETVGPAASVEQAAALIAREAIDLAILDVNISGRSVGEILTALVERRIPLIFMSGYDELALPSWVPQSERFAKPFHVPDLVARLPVLLGRKDARGDAAAPA